MAKFLPGDIVSAVKKDHHSFFGHISYQNMTVLRYVSEETVKSSTKHFTPHDRMYSIIHESDLVLVKRPTKTVEPPEAYKGLFSHG